MANDLLSATDALVKAADKAAENTTKSALDTSFSGSNFKLPTDPDKLGQLYEENAGNLLEELDVTGALGRSRKIAGKAGEASAAAVFENRYQAEELAQTPVADLDTEIERLSEQKWGILPSVLGRTDITDYGAKLKIASRAEQIMDQEINRLTDTRSKIASAADARATTKVEGLKAEAAILDKQADSAQNDLRARIDLFKEGRATFDDIVQAALTLKKLNDEKAKGSGAGNPFFGLDGEVGGFSSAEIAAFQYFESFGEWPVTDSSKLQLKQQLSLRYSQWASSGKPGTTTTEKKLPVLEDPSIKTGADYYDSFGQQPSIQQIPNPFAPVAEAQQSSAQKMISTFVNELLTQ